jgi:hypothetical protein
MSRVCISTEPLDGLGLLGRHDRARPQPRGLSSALRRHLIMGSLKGGAHEHSGLPGATL